MQINIIAVGKNIPSLINMGFMEYAKRMPFDFTIKLLEINPVKHRKNITSDQIIKQEGEKILKAIPKKTRIIALDKSGSVWSTSNLAKQMLLWQTDGRNISLLIGGPEGLSLECLAKAEDIWSLSPLTFPHPLVRIIVMEQLYRAWSILHNHPYHRV